MKIADYIRGLIQLNRVKENPSLIINFENPSEKMQLAAVKANPDLLVNIDNPTEKVQLLAVSKDPSLFIHIKEPTEKVRLIAVNKEPGVIQYIKEPSEKIQLAAVRRDAGVIRYMENPCEKAQLVAVQETPDLIRDIQGPSERVQLAAARKDPGLIRNIENPTEKVQLLVTAKDPSWLADIKEPSEKVCLVLVNKEPDNIRYIENPSEKTQTVAVHRNSFSIEHIKSPCEKAQFIAVRENPANLLKIDTPTRNVCLYCLATVLPEEDIARLRENISEPVKSLFAKLDEVGNKYENFILEAGNMNTGKERFKATEKAEDYRESGTSAAVQAFRKEAVRDAAADRIQDITTEKKSAKNVQVSPEELQFKGGRREMTVKEGKATITSNGKVSDAGDILKAMEKEGVDIRKVPEKTMADMLKGNKVPLPGSAPKTLFAIAKGPAGYTLKAFQIAKQANNIAAQEV